MATLRDARILHSRHHHHEEEKHAMDYDAYRDDQVNTGVIAALIGGFALGNIWEQELESNVDIAAYVLSITAVHACTCSALTSAFLYRILTSHNDEKAVAWAHNHALLMKLPFYKFVMGTLCYLATIILYSWAALSAFEEAQIMAVVVGVMSVMTVIGTGMLLTVDSPESYTAAPAMTVVLPQKDEDVSEDDGSKKLQLYPGMIESESATDSSSQATAASTTSTSPFQQTKTVNGMRAAVL